MDGVSAQATRAGSPERQRTTLSFDALTLHAVADELRKRVVGGQVQKLVLTGPLSLGLEVYARGARTNVLISVDPQAARVCLTRERPARASEAVTPLLLLLRKYVRDGRIEGLDQPPLERILELRFSTVGADRGSDEDGVQRACLIIEVMGRRSNAVLVSEDGTVMDALRRAGRDKNPSRPILPHLAYRPPPSQDRLNPWAMDVWDRLRELAAGAPDARLTDLLGRELSGFSPLLAREAAFRAAESLDATAGAADWTAVHRVVSELLAPARGQALWAPSLARAEGRVVAFAPYRLHHLEATCELSDVSSISEAIEDAYGEQPAASGGRSRGVPSADPLLGPVLESIDARRRLVDRRRNALARSREAAGNPDELREAGQMILALAHEIREGQETLRIGDREIPLDPRETAVENAQRYFRDYKRARDAGRRVPELLQKADLEMAYLDDMEALAEMLDDPGRLRALRDELRSSGVLRDRPPNARRQKRAVDDGARPLTVPLSEGFTALVGTSAKGNERVTFDLAGQEDVWLHARQIPGAHVIVRTGGRSLARPVLLEAAALAAYYSRGRDAGRVAVDWTLRKHVRKTRGGPAGLVSYINEQTVDVEPRPPSPAGRGPEQVRSAG
jgi:predicted ribosome quality control (RQC) complex YloA/Tae2 family protein